MSNFHSSTRPLQPVSPYVCELLPSLSDAAPSPATIAGTVRRRYYNDRQSYRLLDEYAVADGCLESEVMQQISCDVNGDFLFENVFDTSDASRQPIPYAAPFHSNRCLNHNAVVFSHAPPRPIQSAGSILQSPSSTARLWLRRPCSASCAIRGSCGCSCCAAPLCHILLLPHLLFLLTFLLRLLLLLIPPVLAMILWPLRTQTLVAAPLLTLSKIGRPSPLTRLSRSYPTYYSAASTL
jgi:hypothetical protein